MSDDWYEIPNYPDMIVIPFEIPWRTRSGARARAAHQYDWEQPVEQGDASPPPPPDFHQQLLPAPNAGETWPSPRMIAASVKGHPSLAVSGMSNGELTLWRRGTDTTLPEALATLTLDLDDSQLFAGRKFIGRLFNDETALFVPDWLLSLGAAQPQRVGADRDNPAQQPASAPAGTTSDRPVDLAEDRTEPLPQGNEEEHQLLPEDRPIRPVYPIEELALALAGGILGRRAWRILRGIFATISKQLLPGPHSDRMILDLVRPNGQYVGIRAGRARSNVRTVSKSEFGEIVNKLMARKPIAVRKPDYEGTWYELPDGSQFGLRQSKQHGLTLDVNDPDLPRGFRVHRQ